jgi:hypothetical protein
MNSDPLLIVRTTDEPSVSRQLLVTKVKRNEPTQMVFEFC